MTTELRCIKTLSIRLKDRHARRLIRMSRDVNRVWNYTNALSYRAIVEHRNFMSAYDLQKYTAGFTHHSCINAGTIDMVVAEYATRRKQFKKAKLRFRSSWGGRRALGWIPFKKTSFKVVDGGFKYDGYIYKTLDKSYDLSKHKTLSGTFSEDSLGNWYLNISVEIPVAKSKGKRAIGVNLACKYTATDSRGYKLKGQHYHKMQRKLGEAQRAAPMTRFEIQNQYKQQIQKAITLGATKRAERLEKERERRLKRAPASKRGKRVAAIHRKIRNQRIDGLHKYSRMLVDSSAAIFVGDIESLKLAKTEFAKLVLDAGWGELKTMLKYKSDYASIVFEVVDESYTTQICSSCGENPVTSPKGRRDLRIREWACSECGTLHDRDINAAKNILAVGMNRLAEGK